MVRSGSSESRTLEFLTQTSLTVFVIVRCSESRTLECLTSFIQEISSSESRTLEFLITSFREISAPLDKVPLYIEAARLRNLELEEHLWAEPVVSSRPIFTVILVVLVIDVFWPSKKTFGIWSSLVKQKRDECRRKWFGSLVRPARMSTQTMTSHRKLSGSFKRTGTVYSGWLFVDLWGSSTSLDTFRSFGVPGYAAPVSMDSLRCLPYRRI